MTTINIIKLAIVMLYQELENIYLSIKRLDATICALAGAVLNIKNVTAKYRC